MARVVKIPIAEHNPIRRLHPRKQSGARIWRLDVKGRSRQAVFDRPVDGSCKNALIVIVHPEHEAAVDHDAAVVQPLCDGGIIASQILTFVALREIARSKRLETNEQAAETSVCRPFHDVASKDGVDGRRALKEPSHAAHAIEECCRKPRVSEQVIVEKVQMTAGETIDLSESRIDTLCIKGTSPGEKRVLVAEIAMLGATARDHD